MRLQAINSGAVPGRESTQLPGSILRLLGSSFPGLQIGELVSATVREARGGATVLDLKGSPLLAEGLPRLSPGTDVQLKVTGLLPSPTLELVNASRPADTPALTFLVGEEVAARVVQQLPQGNVLLEIQGTPLQATAPSGVVPGTELTVRVAQVQPHVVLQILESTPSAEAQAARMVRAELADPLPAGESVQRVREALIETLAGKQGKGALPASLERLSTALARLVPEDAPHTPESVARFLNESGLFYEAKLARAVLDGGPALGRVATRDVKALVLQALGDLNPSAASSPLHGLTQTLVRHLSQIETQQAANLLAQLHGAPLQLQIPIPSGNDLSTAFLSIEPEGGQGRLRDPGSSGYKILFLLDLDNLGRTRIDAYFSPRTLRIQFYLETAEAVDRVESALPSFRRILEKLGYEEVLAAARWVGEMPTDKRQRVDALPLGIPPGTQLIDVRV